MFFSIYQCRREPKITCTRSLLFFIATSLKSLNTFGVEAYAAELIIIREKSEIPGLIAHIKESDLPYMVIGSGSNVLFTKDFAGTIILNRLCGRQIVKEDENENGNGDKKEPESGPVTVEEKQIESSEGAQEDATVSEDPN